jgi:hypothetical protein
MKKLLLGLILLFACTFTFAQVEGIWKVAPQAGAIGVGPVQGDIGWWSNSIDDLTTRACFFDDQYVFNGDGSFNNVLGDETWLEGWQGVAPDQCGTPIFPHDGSNAATWTYDGGAATLTLDGSGAYMGLPKAANGFELSDPSLAPESITYIVTDVSETAMTLDIDVGGAWWRFIFEKEILPSPAEGTWKVAPQAGALGVGPVQGDIGWWSNSIDDVTTRACFFDDLYVFNGDGSFANVMDGETWLEGWQGISPDQCGAPIFPHDGSNAATWTYDEGAATLILDGTGAYMGIPKAANGFELTDPSQAPESITYIVTDISETSMTLDIDVGGAWWRFIMAKEAVAGEDATLSDLQVDGETISGFFPTITDYTYSLPEGTSDIPQITEATPNDPDVTSVVITQASELPGEATVVVTAVNGTTTLTYTVSLVIYTPLMLPVTFDDPDLNYGVSDFGGNVSEIVVDPTDPDNMVVQSVKGGETWAGTFLAGPNGTGL